MDKEVYSIIIAAIISVITSIVTTIITDGIKSRGKVKLYYKIVFSKFSNQGTWGFRNSDDGIILDVPMWIEV